MLSNCGRADRGLTLNDPAGGHEMIGFASSRTGQVRVLEVPNRNSYLYYRNRYTRLSLSPPEDHQQHYDSTHIDAILQFPERRHADYRLARAG